MFQSWVLECGDSTELFVIALNCSVTVRQSIKPNRNTGRLQHSCKNYKIRYRSKSFKFWPKAGIVSTFFHI